MVRRLFELQLRYRWAVIVLLLALTAVSAALTAAYVRPDFSVEYLFPAHDQSRIDYNRYKLDFPYEDARALVVVEAPDIFTREGLARIKQLEHDLANIEGVVDTDGLTTVLDVVEYQAEDGETGIKSERLVPHMDLTPAEIEQRRYTATHDPLFKWNVCPPDGGATTIRVNLQPGYAAKDDTRMQFLVDARKVLAQHARPGQKIVLNGLPVIRAEYTELIESDMGTLMPLAAALTLLLLYLSFRTIGPIVAAFLTIVASVMWTYGACGIMGYPIQLLTQLTPIICMIVSISDTVHIVSEYHAGLREGLSAREAIVASLVDSAGPCLLTEVVIAFGFLGLLFQDVVLITQFGALCAVGMMLTWLANVTVLPIALSFVRPKPRGETEAEGKTGATLVLERFLGWIDRTTQNHPRRVVGAAVAIFAVAIGFATQIGREYYSYDDLYHDSALYQNMRYVEKMHGGSVPMAVLVEPPPREVLLIAEAAEVPDAVDAAFRGGALRYRLHVARGREAAFRFLRREPPFEDAPRPSVIAIELGVGLREGHRLLKELQGIEETAGAPLVTIRRAGASGTQISARQLVEDYLVYDSFDLGDPKDRARLPFILRGGEPMLDPVAVRLTDRIATYLEDHFPEMKQAGTAADYWRKIHRLWVGKEEAARDPFPATAPAAAQELAFFDTKPMRDFLAPDRAKAAVFGMLPDMGSSRSTELIDDLRGYLDREEKATGYKLTLTGIFSIADGIYRTMVMGLGKSLGFAVLVSLLVFTVVLRSWRLGLIALVPNVLPLLLTFGLMAAMGIDLKPTTVICFSITLVIADDDTIQFLVRYRRRFLEVQAQGVPDAHSVVASETLDATGVPMFLTACSVSIGFLTLVASEFIGLRNLGILIGVSLFTAVFADLFLSPIMLRTFRPQIGTPPPAAAEPAPVEA